MKVSFAYAPQRLHPSDHEASVIPLRSIYLNLTTACNLRCRHCFIEAGPSHDEELEKEEIRRLLDDVAVVAPEKLTFTGGEPTLRPDFLELAEYASNLRGEGIERLALATNATLIDARLADAISSLFDQVNVSVDGLENENDLVRGSGSFRNSIRGLRLLVRAGADPTVFITVTSQNLTNLERIIAYLYRFEGVLHFRLRPVWRFGRAIENPELRAEKEVLEAMLVRMDLIDYDRKPPGLPLLGYSLNVHANGDVYPCHLLRYPEFVGGNVRRESLSRIFYRSAIFCSLREANITCCETFEDPRHQVRELLASQGCPRTTCFPVSQSSGQWCRSPMTVSGVSATITRKDAQSVPFTPASTWGLTDRVLTQEL